MKVDGDPRWSALLTELARLGFVEHETIEIQRWSGRGRGRYGTIARLAIEGDYDVVVSQDPRASRSIKERSGLIPVVNIGSFPPDWNLIESFDHPGGSVTGLAPVPVSEIFAKQVQLLQMAVPRASRVGWLGPKRFWEHELTGSIHAAAEGLGLELEPMRIDYPIEEATIQRAFLEAETEAIDALFVTPAADLYRRREAVVEMANRVKLPAISLQREYAEQGLLMSYLTDEPERYRVAAGYVDRILRGVRPGDIPVQLPTAFDLVINMRAANVLGLNVPETLLAQATELIE